MTRNQICEDILRNHSKNKLKESAKHLKEDEDDWEDEEEIDKDFTTEDAVQDAFPMISPHTVEIIAKWYENEYAIDDFDSLQEFSEHISSDFLDMFWAGDYDEEEFHEVAQDMINVGYYDADRFPYDDGNVNVEDVEFLIDLIQKNRDTMPNLSEENKFVDYVINDYMKANPDVRVDTMRGLEKAYEAYQASIKGLAESKSKRKIKEDVWDDIADIERGGFDEFRDDEYENSERARHVRDAANAAGMSELDYVNMEDLFEKDPDLEDVVNGSFSEFLIDDEGNPGLEDARTIFDNLYNGTYKGMYDGDYQGDAEACLIDVIEGYNQSAWEAQVPLKGVRMFATDRMRGFFNEVTEYEARLQYLAQYKDDPRCPRCKQYFDALATYARQINEIADEYNLAKYKITIPGEGLTESKKRNLKESLFLGNEINPEKPFSEEWTKWVQKCQRWLDKETMPRGPWEEGFFDILHAVEDELGSYRTTPRQNYVKGLAEKGYRRAQEFLEKFPEPDMYATGEVKEEEPITMYALFTDGGNAYSAGRGADWYWASSDADETEKDFKARVRYSAKRKAEKKYYEYDPRTLKCKFFKSLDAFKREAAKVGINPDLSESRKTNKKAIKEEVWEDEAYVDGIIEKFCILMDWEIKPEDIDAVAETCGKYIMHLRNGESFTYDPENDCIED